MCQKPHETEVSSWWCGDGISSEEQGMLGSYTTAFPKKVKVTFDGKWTFKTLLR